MDIFLIGFEKDIQDSVVQKEVGCDQKEVVEFVYFQQQCVYGRKDYYFGFYFCCIYVYCQGLFFGKGVVNNYYCGKGRDFEFQF